MGDSVSRAETQVASLTRNRWMKFSLAALLFIVLCIAGILGGARIAQQRLRLNPDPLQLTVPQRSTIDIPGLRGLAKITLDDITDDQVTISVRDDTGALLLAPTSVRRRDGVAFPLRGQTFHIRILRLNNNLVGDDFGVLEVSTH